jgi:hypothetical protein
MPGSPETSTARREPSAASFHAIGPTIRAGLELGRGRVRLEDRDLGAGDRLAATQRLKSHLSGLHCRHDLGGELLADHKGLRRDRTDHGLRVVGEQKRLGVSLLHDSIRDGPEHHARAGPREFRGQRVLFNFMLDGLVLSGCIADEQLQPGDLGDVHGLVRIETVAEDRGGCCATFIRDDKGEVRGCRERGETRHE